MSVVLCCTFGCLAFTFFCLWMGQKQAMDFATLGKFNELRIVLKWLREAEEDLMGESRPSHTLVSMSIKQLEEITEIGDDHEYSS